MKGDTSKKLRVLVMTPPMTQLNAPYPATTYLTAFLRQQGYLAEQLDPAIELAVSLFSTAGIQALISKSEEAATRDLNRDHPRGFFLNQKEKYLSTVNAVISFLQNKDPTLANRIASRRFLPEGPRFSALAQFPNEDPMVDPTLAQLNWAFGALGIQDQAKYLASLYLDDLGDWIRMDLDSKFTLSRYGEKLASSQGSFDLLENALEIQPLTWIDQWLENWMISRIGQHQPDVIGLSVPFPGNVYAAFRLAKIVKRTFPGIFVFMGGGYPNTELRELAEVKVFRYFDAITLDDGEEPFLRLLNWIEGGAKEESTSHLLRTFILKRSLGNDEVTYIPGTGHDIPEKHKPAPVYDGLPLDKYLSIVELLNPMHRLWSDGRWNKLTLAHGCYWKKCTFCDTTLDYIGRYDPSPVDGLIDKMVKIAEETGQTGFHFVDEAAPPIVLKNLSKRLLERDLTFTWWGNIRFEKTFDSELATLMAKAGCVAVSGGLEVASPRILEKIQKGVTVEQVTKVTQNFADAGIWVHAYLMYGFPSQTLEEVLESLENTRLLFEAGNIQSAFWHRFSVTAHSEVGKNPAKFGVKLLEDEPAVRFARNDIQYEDLNSNVPWGQSMEQEIAKGLKRAIYNYMHGLGFDRDIRSWFDIQLPKRNRTNRRLSS